MACAHLTELIPQRETVCGFRYMPSPGKGNLKLSLSLIVPHKAVHAQKPYRGAKGEPVYTVGKPFQRDQPASWDFLMENL